LDQVNERNNYRAALIDYQRARRNYMAFEDNVKLEIRRSWRRIAVFKENFETSREAVRIAAAQLDSAVQDAGRPLPPGGSRQAGQQGLNLLNALNTVLDTQDELINIWVQYEENRLNIHRDMGIMEIDARGTWNDDIYQQPTEPGPSAEEAGPVELPPQPAASVGRGRSEDRLARFGPPVCRPAGRVGRRKQAPPGRNRGRVVQAGFTAPSRGQGVVDRHSGAPGADGWHRHVPAGSSKPVVE